MPATPARNIRVDDDRWAYWRSVADVLGVTVTGLVITATDKHLEEITVSETDTAHAITYTPDSTGHALMVCRCCGRESWGRPADTESEEAPYDASGDPACEDCAQEHPHEHEREA